MLGIVWWVRILTRGTVIWETNLHQSLSDLPAHVPAARVAHACPPAKPFPALTRTLRETRWRGYPAGCRGDSAIVGSSGNTLLGPTDSLVARARWGTPPGHVPGVRFATRESASDACYGSDGCCWNA